MHGGEQENGIRASTLAVHDIVGFGKAAEIVVKEKEAVQKYYKELDKEIIPLLLNTEAVKLVGDLTDRLPGIYSIIVDKNDFNNERFLKKMSKEISLSTGSACTAGQPSYVLKAIGLGKYTSKVLRISVGNSVSLENTVLSISSLLKCFTQE